MDTEKPIAAVPMYKASLIQPAHTAKKRELSTQPTCALVSQGTFLDCQPTWLQRMIAVEDARCEARIPENRPVRKLANNFVRRNDPDHLEK